ncbi:MAG: carboxypeptidase regulatory-like domain-containing protein [Planctomycetia bacterium]|nr:carboxypeptidase regulatory-like domain-containing protein [Planctomycetia bacterium]
MIGYVSDERYVALPGVLFEFQRSDRSVEARSRATGAVYAILDPGPWRVTMHLADHGSKSVEITVDPARPYHFRMLRDTLLGYAWPKWVKAGERGEFRVHSPEMYKLELWRYGWKKELVRSIGWFDEHGPRATVQITPDGDYTRTGVDWNKIGYNNNPVHRQFELAPTRSGLYYFHARTKSGRFFSFPWIVAPAKPTAKIAVLAGNINWNCYNSFGGRSNYIHCAELPAKPTVNSRQDLDRYTDPEHIFYDRENYAPLSFDRPEPFNHVDEQEQITDPIEGRQACHLAPAEWRLYGWLEREGIDFDLYAETQFHHGEMNLDDYRLVIIHTHPEYWSRKMYLALKDWVFRRGGRLMYLGGNGLNCEVEFDSPTSIIVRNGDKREQRRKEVESRMHERLESEANLLGVVYTDAGAMTGAPYRVIEPKHWAFSGTDLKAGDLFGLKCLHMRCPGGASGHETDKISPSSPKNLLRIAQGTNRDNGGADMIYFETPKGGAVFSSGSINYVSSLPVDEHISKITKNVIERLVSP